MKYITSILALCVTLFAQTLRAENTVDLEYLQYSITDKTGTPVNAPADGGAALALNTPEKILFVRDKNQADASYYIAVFELTRAQAMNLGWSSSNENAAFGAIVNTTDNSLKAPLAYPTVAQWRAYAEDKIARNCNVTGGTAASDTPMTAEDWYSEYLLSGGSYCNRYGLYDTYGNVAEATLEDDGSLVFQGWYTTYSSNFEALRNMTLDNLEQSVDQLTKFVETNPAGVRPIYIIPPEGRVYTVTVTHNGVEVPELRKENIKSGETVTIDPLTLSDGAILNEGYTVTPETLDITSDAEGNLTFTMPAAHVTIAYTSFYQAQIEVIDGTTDKTVVKANETFTITASNEGAFLYWEGPEGLITEANKTQKTITLSLSSIEKAETITFTAKFEPRATLLVENATADKSVISAGDTVKVTANERGFSHWEGFGVTATNKNDLPLTIKVQSVNDRETVTLKAIYLPKATISVVNGTSSATDAYSNERITLTANAITGTAFSHWTGPYGLTETNKFDNPLTISLNQLTADTAITYTAHFKPVTTLEVVNGVANETKVFEGKKVTITPSDSRAFSHWEGDFITESNKTNNPLVLTIGTFEVGQALKITAVKKPKATISVVNGTSSSGEAYKGEEITLTAQVPEGERFSHWTGPYGITEYNRSENPLTIRLNQHLEDVEITYTAELKSHTTLEVINGTANVTKVFEGDKVTIKPSDSRAFSHWEGDFITESNKTSNPLVLTIGTFEVGQALKITAVKKPKATISVVNGTSSSSEAYKGEEITLTAQVPEGERFSHWTGPYGITEYNRSENPLTIRLNQHLEDVEITYTAHFKKAANLKVVNGAATPVVTTVYEGDKIAIKSVYNERSFSHWEGDFVTNYNKKDDPITLTIGNVTEGQTVTITAVQKPLATIKVIQGSSTEASVYKDESFTLVATIPEGKAFSHWTGPYGITESNLSRNPLEISLDNLTKDETLTYQAHVKDYPRVLVYGGFVELENGVNDRGDGYYNVDARMTITPYDNAPKGYEFSHWLKNNQTKITTKEYTFKVEGLGTVNTFEAIYKISTPVNEEVIHIGAISETDLTTRTTIGYVAASVKNVSYDNNKFAFYDTIEAPEDYAVLDLVKKTISMDAITANNIADANSNENRLNALVMKRPAGKRYYVGIHEVTEAQYNRVVKGGATPNPEEGLYPHTTTNTTRAEANTFMTSLSKMFGLTFEKPTKAQIEAISTGAQNYMGKGDPAITQAMVNSKEDGRGLALSGAQDVDPYGFYDLWGNAAETLKGDDSNLWGGYYDANFQYCNMASPISAKLMINPGAIRPAIEVPTRYKVTVTNVGQTTHVFPGQTITLKTQVRAGCQFKNWTITAGGKTSTYAAATMPKTITITEDTTLTANFYEPLEIVTLSYNGDCIGAASAYPGTTVKVYPTAFGKSLENITVSPATAATVDLKNETITLAENVTGSVVISTTTQSSGGDENQQVQITFDANGGTGGKTVTQAVGTPLTAPTVTREGYTFKGWSPEVPATAPVTNTTYVAQWQVNQYTITFDANGGVGGKAVTQDYGSALVAPTVTRTGYTFTGWSPAVPATVPAQNVTYTAQWKSTTSDDEEHDPEFDDVEKVNINNLVVTIKSNKITIVGYDGTLDGWLDIPETIKGLNVVAIGDNAFQNQKKLVYVTLPKTLTSIGKNAFFGCTALDVNKVKLPTGFKKLGKSAFTNCKVTREVIAVPGEPIASTHFDEAKGYKLATTTSGVKLNSKTGAITATIKKPGSYDIVLFKAGAKLKMTRITIKEFVKVDIKIEGSDGNCTVKGEGDYLYGKKVTLTAKASKNRIFDGFYYADGSLFSKGLKTSWTMKNEDLNLIARFKTENITIDVAKFAQTQWYVGKSYTLPLSITADSGAKSVKAKLPAGLKLAKTKEGSWQVIGSPKKVGDYTMSFTVTTTQKQTKTEVLPITVHKENVIYDLSAVHDLILHVGELTSKATISASAFSDIKSIKASKLPSGMKIQKVGENLWQLTGAPKKAGTYTVTLTITTKANTKVTETFTLTVALIPEWAVKTFSGEVHNIWDDGNFDTSVIAQISVRATGEVDGDIYFEDGSHALLDSTAKLLESSANKVRLQLVVPWFDAEGKADGKVKTELIIQNNNGAVTLNYQDSTKGSSVRGNLIAE